MVAAGRRSSWIFEIAKIFEPLDRSFRNNGPERAITSSFHFSEIQDGGGWTAANLDF
jgi:hypothetical protein